MSRKKSRLSEHRVTRNGLLMTALVVWAGVLLFSLTATRLHATLDAKPAASSQAHPTR